MVTPGKPIIDTRTSVVDGKQRAVVSSDSNSTSQPGTSTPSSQSATNSQATTNAPAQSGGMPSSTPTASTSTSSGAPASSATTTVKTTAPLSTTIPAQYTASNYDELIPELERRMAEYKPLSEDDLKKLRRKQKIEGIISGVSDAAQSVANLIFTHHYAPNMYDAKEGLSAKARERFDKEKAQRDADADKYYNYAMTIAKLKDAEQERGLRAWQIEQTLAREDRAFDAGRKDREDDVAFRNRDYDERVRQWQAGFDRYERWHKEEGERWEKQFTESIRQFNVSSANERARIGMEAQRLAHSLKEGQMTFNLGSGNGNVTLSLDKLNAQTVSRIFSTLDKSVREKVKGDPIMEQVVQNGVPIYGLDGKPQMQIVGYNPPTTEAMLIAIGANVGDTPATQNAIRQVAGLEMGEKPKGY